MIDSLPLSRRISLEGQSNAVGLASKSDIATLSDTSLAAYANNPFARVFIFNPSSGAYENLRIGVNNMGLSSTQFGPEFGLAVRWMRETVRGNLYIDKNASGGQPISYFMEGTSVFTALLNNTTAQNAWLATNKVRPAHMGWIWLQGETDRALVQSDYESMLITYINSRTNHALMTLNGLQIIGQVPTNSTQYGAGVAAAKVDYVSNNPTKSRLIQYGDLGSDSLHMNAKGCVQIGYTAFSQLFSKPTLTLA